MTTRTTKLSTVQFQSLCCTIAHQQAALINACELVSTYHEACQQVQAGFPWLQPSETHLRRLADCERMLKSLIIKQNIDNEVTRPSRGTIDSAT
jgi:hypothetical protein